MAKRRNKQHTHLETKNVMVIMQLISDISLKLHPKPPMAVSNNQSTKYGKTGIEKPQIVVRKI
jgi:hypothetical protein